MSEKLYNECNSDIIELTDVEEALNQLKNSCDKFEICSSIETLNYCFSVILSEIRQSKREVVTSIFEQRPKLADEKSVLEKKLDSVPEYAKYKEKEEFLFQFLEHLQNIKSNINWLIKDEEK